MRKNSPRKILHAILDLLPVLIIPVFALAVRSDNNYQPISVEYSRDLAIDFNQLINNSYFRDDFSNYGVSFVRSGDTFLVTGENTNNARVQWYCTNTITIQPSHIYYVTTYRTGDFNNLLEPRISIYYDDDSRSYPSLPFRLSNAKLISYYLQNDGTHYDYDFSIQFQLFDLTQMYGVGNEPSNSQFLSDFPNNYYSYVLSDKQLIKDYQILTYDNQDVGSQLLYSIYQPVHDYMNFNNVFGFGNIYDWLQLNIFNGTAPMSVFIVWNIFLYEFLMDLIFLLYGLFMFFIDFCSNLMERFHYKASGGR